MPLIYEYISDGWHAVCMCAGRYEWRLVAVSSIYVLVHHKDMLYGINTEDSDSGSLLLLTSTISLLAKIKEDASGFHQAYSGHNNTKISSTCKKSG